MKKVFIQTIFRGLVLFMLAGGLLATAWGEITYDPDTWTYSGSGTWSEAVTITNPTTFHFLDTETATFSGTITGNNSATKTGDGNWVISSAGTVLNNEVTIDAGTVTLNAQRSAKAFRGTVTVNAGATLVSGSKDAFGYAATTNPTVFYLNGGTLHKTVGENETLGSVDIYFTGGTMSADTGHYDILRSDVRFFVLAAQDATAEAPTVSTISAPLLLRNAIANGFSVDVAANAHLDITGAISADIITATSTYPTLIKTGAGILTLANTGSAGMEIQAGTANLTGSSSGAISIASGATANLSGASSGAISIASGGTAYLTAANSGGITVASGGTVYLQSTGHAQLDISGTANVERGGGDRLMADKGVIHIRDGGVLNLNMHDSMGYAANGSTTVNIYQGGRMINTTSNDSFRNMTFNLYGGTIDSNTGRYDILDTLNFNILPAEGATETTVSTVKGTWNFRTDTLSSDGILSLNVAENAELRWDGMFQENGMATPANPGRGTLVKSGEGILRLTNAKNTAPQPVMVEAGTLIVENKALAKTSHLTITQNATLDPTTAGTSLGGNYTLGGRQNLYFDGDGFNPFEVTGTIEILDTAKFFLISENPLDYQL
ncbi:MAG: hypothetical protein Q4E67_05230, partial [Planctomycetia bacterium]|nr:hypothetical protein [Planctomycetia bacterium]